MTSYIGPIRSSILLPLCELDRSPEQVPVSSPESRLVAGLFYRLWNGDIAEHVAHAALGSRQQVDGRASSYASVVHHRGDLGPSPRQLE